MTYHVANTIQLHDPIRLHKIYPLKVTTYTDDPKMIVDSGNLITKAVTVSATRILCSIDQCPPT